MPHSIPTVRSATTLNGRDFATLASSISDVPDRMAASALVVLLCACYAESPQAPEHVDPGNGLPARIAVLPGTVQVSTGAPRQFTARVTDENGEAVEGGVSWAATGGSIDRTGLYIAGPVPGSYVVVGRARRDLADTAVITVSPPEEAPETWIYPGEDIQALVDSHPPGTQFVIKPGVHRLQQVEPKPGNSFIGEPGAVLSGARLLSDFTRDGAYWITTGQDSRGKVHGECLEEHPRCDRSEDLFLDDEPLLHVAQLEDVGPGRWYFDYEAGKIYLADDPEGHVVELGVSQHAFRGEAEAVEVRGLVIEKYASPAQQGAIFARGRDPEATLAHSWVIADNEVRLNHGVGIAGLGHGAVIRDNYIHHNGQLGIGGLGDDLLVEGNEIAFNNTRGFDWGWEAGGTKFVRTRNLVVRNNHVHHNAGPGLWTDIENIGTLYEDNVVEDNDAAGIFHEISYDAVIRNNEVRRNGSGWATWLWGAGILVAGSSNVEVYGNLVVQNFNGITAVQQERGTGKYGPHLITNLHVHDNEIRIENDGAVGLIDGRSDSEQDPAIYTEHGNRFQANIYYLGGRARPFHWLQGWSTPEAWQEQGQDTSGIFHAP